MEFDHLKKNKFTKCKKKSTLFQTAQTKSKYETFKNDSTLLSI